MTSSIAERSSGRRTTSLCPAPANDEAYFGMSQKFEQLKFVFGTHESLARHSALRRSPTREVSGGTQRDTDLRRHQES